MVLFANPLTTLKLRQIAQQSIRTAGWEAQMWNLHKAKIHQFQPSCPFHHSSQPHQTYHPQPLKTKVNNCTVVFASTVL